MTHSWLLLRLLSINYTWQRRQYFSTPLSSCIWRSKYGMRRTITGSLTAFRSCSLISMWNLRTLFSLPNHKGQIYKDMLIMFCCVAFLNFSLQTLRKTMIVECYFDRTEATEFLKRGVREEVARRDVLHPVAAAPIYTVPREEVAPRSLVWIDGLESTDGTAMLPWDYISQAWKLNVKPFLSLSPSPSRRSSCVEGELVAQIKRSHAWLFFSGISTCGWNGLACFFKLGELVWLELHPQGWTWNSSSDAWIGMCGP